MHKILEQRITIEWLDGLDVWNIHCGNESTELFVKLIVAFMVSIMPFT